MKTEWMSNLLSIGESVGKTASVGGQLIADKISVYGFFVVCLLFVGCFLTVPALIYEKYYKVEDDDLSLKVDHDKQKTTGPAA